MENVDALRRLDLVHLQRLHSSLMLAIVQGHGIQAAISLVGTTLQWLAVSDITAPRSGTLESSSTSVAARRWRSAHVLLRTYDPWTDFPLHLLPVERAVRRTWDVKSGAWAADIMLVKVAKDAFAQGAMRWCHRLLLRRGSRTSPWQGPACNWVAKHCEDVRKSQTHAQRCLSVLRHPTIPSRNRW